jgi:hypothetical protein
MSNPNVLTIDSTITCPHGGPGTLTFPGVNNKLKVQGKSVLLTTDLTDPAKTMVSGCIPPPPPPPSKKCSLVKSITSGEASKLKVGGIPVLLDTLIGLTDGLPVPPDPTKDMTVTKVQNKLTAI